ncbi:MAG: hypothetical protein ACXU9U_02220, partial [Parachlamydiaceae bacterium]
MDRPQLNANEQEKCASQSLSGKQKNTALALSLASCLLMGAVGYGTIRETSLTAATTSSIHEPKASLIAKKSQSFSLSSADNFLDEEDDNYQIKQLKEHNAKQAAKIKALRQELIEKMQDLYAVKAHLFKQEGDPRDKEK